MHAIADHNQLLLAIETSSLRGSVALGRGADVPGWRGLSAERRHTTELMPAIQDMLTAAGCTPRDVEVVCFSQGPGSFTGLRVAATIARMWQSATGCAVVAVPTPEVIARNALERDDSPPQLAVVLDARQQRIFGTQFEMSADGELWQVAPTELHDADAWISSLPPDCAVIGDGIDRHRAALDQRGLRLLPAETWLPDARQVLTIGRRLANAGRFCRPEQIVPAYHRPPECEEVYERRRAAARARRAE